MTSAEMKAKEKVSALSTKQLLDQFDLTEIIKSPYISIVRGWIMDELEKRNPQAFDAWIDSDDDTPRRFF